MSFKSFLKSRTFFFNLFLAILFFAVITWVTMSMLKVYTHHGEKVSIPNLKGYTEYEVKSILKEKKLRYTIIDSAFVATALPGSIIDQQPEEGYMVKERRTVYLTIAALSPEKILVPKVVDVSLREAKSKLENAGFVIGKVEYRPSEFQNLVLGSFYKGQQIPADTALDKGSVVDLIVGKGLSDEKTPVPNLIGMMIDNAKDELFDQSLNVGVLIYDDSFETAEDSLNAKIWKQVPAAGIGQKIELGSSIDIWLTVDELKLEEDAGI